MLDFTRTEPITLPIDRKAERLLIIIAWTTMALGALSWLAFRPFPSIHPGITFSIFGLGFIALAIAGMMTGVFGWRLGAVYRAEGPFFFWFLIFTDIMTGIAIILVGWYL